MAVAPDSSFRNFFILTLQTYNDSSPGDERPRKPQLKGAGVEGGTDWGWFEISPSAKEYFRGKSPEGVGHVFRNISQ